MLRPGPLFRGKIQDSSAIFHFQWLNTLPRMRGRFSALPLSYSIHKNNTLQGSDRLPFSRHGK